MISSVGKRDPNYILSHDVSQQISDRQLVEKETLTSIDSVHPTFYIETSHLFFMAKRMTDFYLKCRTGLK